MTYLFTVSPDFPPARISGWFIFNTWLQRRLDTGIHLGLHDDFAHQRADIAAGKVDLIYANPYDAALLVREKGFVPVARPRDRADEAVIAVPAQGAVQRVEDLEPGARIASTDDPDVRTMGMIMIEPADLGTANTTAVACDNYVLVAKALLSGTADAGFFLKQAFDELSEVTRRQLRQIVESHIYVVHHALMAGPRLAARRDDIRAALLGMESDPKGRDILASLGIAAWDPLEEEDTEFMIDLMDTLT
jgi:phosphonate transport system substrate-binding protein